MDDKTPRPGVTWFVVAGFFALSWCVYLAFFLPKGNGASSTADYGWKYFNLDDSKVEFSKFKGKTVFVNVWATWCPPCVKEMPSIARLAANPRLKDVAFVCVSVDEETSTVRNFLRGKDWPMTFLRAHSLPDAFQTEGIPATFIVAPDGKVVFSEVGGMEWDSPENVERLEGLARDNQVKK